MYAQGAVKGAVGSPPAIAQGAVTGAVRSLYPVTL